MAMCRDLGEIGNRIGNFSDEFERKKCQIRIKIIEGVIEILSGKMKFY